MTGRPARYACLYDVIFMMVAATYGRLRSGWEVPVLSVCSTLGPTCAGVKCVETKSHSTRNLLRIRRARLAAFSVDSLAGAGFFEFAV